MRVGSRPQAAAIAVPLVEWVLAQVEVAVAAIAAQVAAVAMEAVSAAVAAQVVPEADLAQAVRAGEVIALCRGVAYAASAWTKLSILITRTWPAFGSTCPSVPRLSRAARPARVLGISAP